MFHVIQPSIMIYLGPLICAVVILLMLPLSAVGVFLVGRKVAADAQVRSGAARVDSQGFLQPIEEVVTVLLKQDVASAKANRMIFWVAPLISATVALLAFSVLPIGPAVQVSDLNIGLLFVWGITSLGVYGILLRGGASNSHCSLIGTLRTAAQAISNETAAVLGLISALLLSGSLSMKEIVQAQLDQGQWFIFYVPVGFVIYFLSTLAGTNLASFESAEADTQIVAGRSNEYIGFRRILYFLAEYANMIIMAGIATTVFLGGWLRPLASYRDRFPGTSVELLDVLPAIAMVGAAVYCFRLAPKLPVHMQRVVTLFAGGFCTVAAAALAGALLAPESLMQGVHGAFWFIVKMGAYIYCVFWYRFVFSPAHLDRLRALDWRILIPVGFLNLNTAAVAILTSQNTGLPMRLTTMLAMLATGAVGWRLARDSSGERAVLTADGE